ncbi:DNA topoisomerase I [Strigomonas culicis]|uniref:DNA topoisomerase n=1 Tax=Strigomonas culicis TaxID=28005 RepID=S9V0P8_9TRYP|nr:DNA topoisomerase I [Strigomonas culicis]|eukprot:EPY20486.1 DNA topoisomerase I [Strigomonas culicis]
MMRRTISFLEKLVIVESPNKVIKVEDLLSDPAVISDWSFQNDALKRIGTGPEKTIAMATTGHFMFLKDLSWRPTALKSTLPDEEFPQNGMLASFLLEWEVLPGRHIQDTVTRYITEKANDISEIIIATDPDREGELIAVHALNLVRQICPDLDVPFTRAYMHSITKDGIRQAMENRTTVFDRNLATAAEARHAMDRIFGFLGSSVVRYANPQMRSIGRVQTPALILINEREDRITKFLNTHRSKYEPRAVCHFKSNKVQSLRKWSPSPPSWKIKYDWESEKEVRQAVSSWKLESASRFQVVGTPQKTTKVVQAPAPLTMASLITKANRQLQLTSEEVSASLQDLFQMGYITYPRTDSSRIDESALPSIYSAVKAEFGSSLVARGDEKASSRRKKGGSKKKTAEDGNVEDAHEAIRPTDMKLKASGLGEVAAKTKRVYDLIRKHTLAAFMVPMHTSRVEATVSFTSSSGKEFLFTLQGKHAVEPGWSLALTGKGSASTETDMDLDDLENGVAVVQTVSGEEFKAIENLKAASGRRDAIRVEKPQVTEIRPTPPLPFSEGGLIQELKNNGVGRPSTYPMIVKTLLARSYITVVDGRCKTTDVGRLVVDTSKTTFPSIVDIGFTSSFEKKLDRIAKPANGALKEYKNISEADVVLSSFLSKFLNYVTEATRNQRACIVERSLTLKREQSASKESDREFQETVRREREKIMSQVPDLVESGKAYRTFTALQNSLTDYLRRHFPPAPPSAWANAPRPFKKKNKYPVKSKGRFSKK